jgi:hypothetical protein
VFHVSLREYVYGLFLVVKPVVQEDVIVESDSSVV